MSLKKKGASPKPGIGVGGGSIASHPALGSDAHVEKELRDFMVSQRDNAGLTLKLILRAMEEKLGSHVLAQRKVYIKERSKELHLELHSVVDVEDASGGVAGGKKRARVNDDSSKQGRADDHGVEVLEGQEQRVTTPKPSKKGYNVLWATPAPAEPSRLDSSFDSAMFAPRGGPASLEQNSVEFFAEFEQIMGQNQRRFDDASQFVHPSVYIDKIVKQGCFKSVAVELPIMFSPHYLGDPTSAHGAVSMQLGKHLFRYKHDLGGMPLSHSAFRVKGAAPLLLPVHAELKGWLTFTVCTDFLVLAPAVGSSMHIAITSLDRNRANGRCVATVLFLCEVRFEAVMLGKFFHLTKGKWTTRDGIVELCERDVIQVRTTRVSSGEGGVSIALDVDAMPDEMELIKPDGSVYVVNTKGEANMTQFLHPIVEAEKPKPGPQDSSYSGPTAADAPPQDNEPFPLSIRLPALYNTKLDIQVRPKDSLRSLQRHVMQTQQVENVQVTELVLVRTGEVLWPADSFLKAGVGPGDVVIVKTEVD